MTGVPSRADARRPWRRGAALIAFWLAVALLLPPATARAGNSIFDDDWTPAPGSAPSAPAPTPTTPPPTRTTPAVPAPTPTPAPSPTPSPEPTPPASQPSTAPASPPRIEGPHINAGAPPEAPKLLPVPAAADQAKSRKLFKEAFADDLKDPSPGARKALAAKLMSEADKMVDNPTDRFVLLIGACRAAVEGIDLRLAGAAAKSVASIYQVDALHLSVDTVLKTPLKPATAAQAADAVAAGLDIDSELLQADDYSDASKLLAALEPLVARAQSAKLRARLQALTKELGDARAAFDQFQGAKLLLKNKPNDAEANSIVGKYIWLSKADVDGALPYLAKAQEPELRALARGDQAATSDADAPARGDAWAAFAAKQSGPEKFAADLRASSFYRTALNSASGLEKLSLEKRSTQINADIAAYANAHGIRLDPDPAAILEKRDVIEQSVTKPLAGPISGKVTLPPSPTPYLLGKAPVKITGTLTIAGGTEIRGGTLSMAGTGRLIIAAEKGKPVIFRHVIFGQDLGASLKADGAIFDDCTFKKTGGYYNRYSSKWSFTSCVLYSCQFGGLSENDYGFQLRSCALLAMTFPEIQPKHGRNFSHPDALHSQWNRIESCEFIDCKVPPTVCWCADTSDYYDCTFIPGDPAEAFESDKPFQVTAFITDTVGTAPETVWIANPPRRATVTLSVAADRYPTLPLAGIDAAIPEIFVSPDGGVSVVK